MQSDGTVSVETATSDNTTISYSVMGDANKMRLLSQSVYTINCERGINFVLSAFIAIDLIGLVQTFMKCSAAPSLSR